MKKAALIVNYNLYESKRHFTEKLQEALKKKGVETLLIDVKEKQLGFEAIANLKHFRPNFTLSFNTLLPIAENKFLWDLLQTPHIAALVDPAIYSTNVLISPYSIVSSVDRQDVDYLKELPFEKTFFWPHAVEADLNFDPKEEKNYEVVFFGSCYDYESLMASWRRQNSVEVNKVLDDAIEIVLSDNKTSLSEALVAAWNKTSLPPQEVDFATLFYYLDQYTRGYDRVQLIRAIKDVPVHVFGELSDDNAIGVLGWQQYLAGQKNVTLHPSVPFKESLEILKKSKIALNSQPFFKSGSHERIFTALATGAVPVTSNNLFTQDFFKEGVELVTFKPKQYDEAARSIYSLLQDEPKRQTIALQGREKVMKEHTWDVRAEELLANLAKWQKP